MGYEFFGEKFIFPSAPFPGINNDQSLTQERFPNVSDNRFFQAEKLPEKRCQQRRILKVP